MKVLVVEPDKQLARNYEAALTNAGNEVLLARNAQVAIHALDESEVDIILLELHIKEHNGVEFLYELRSYSEWQNIPVIIVSFVHPDKFFSDEKLMQRLGIVEYLYKPSALLEQVVGAVNRAKEPLLS